MSESGKISWVSARPPTAPSCDLSREQIMGALCGLWNALVERDRLRTEVGWGE